MIRAGELRHRVALQANQPTVNDYGEEINLFVTYVTVWGAIKDLSVTETQNSNQTQGISTHTVTIRHSTEAAVVKAADRLVINGRTFEVVGATNIEDRNRQIDILCKEAA